MDWTRVQWKDSKRLSLYGAQRAGSKRKTLFTFGERRSREDSHACMMCNTVSRKRFVTTSFLIPQSEIIGEIFRF